MDAGHNRLALHGRGAAYSRGDAERLMHKLVIEGVLIEELKITAADTAACYIRLGPKAASLMQNKMKVSYIREVCPFMQGNAGDVGGLMCMSCAPGW